MVLGGEMYVYAFVLDSWKVNDINGILNDCPCVFSSTGFIMSFSHVFYIYYSHIKYVCVYI